VPTVYRLPIATTIAAPAAAPTAVAAAAPPPPLATQGIPARPEDDTAENAAAVAALVVDSVVESTVAAVMGNNTNQTGLPTISTTNAPPTAGAAAAAAIAAVQAPPAVAATTAIQLTSTSTLPLQFQPQTQTPALAPSVTVKAPPTSSASQTYNNLQKSKRKERLEQNRISARESRKRKKSMIEELQRTVIGLTAEHKELNGRNQSLRSNLAEIGRKYPNSASIQAILNGIPHPSPQHRQQPAPGAPNHAAAIKLGGLPMPTNYLLSQQQLTAAAASTAHALQNVASFPVVPIMAAGAAASPQMIVPYMYIPQAAAHAVGGLVPIAVPRHPGQPVVAGALAATASPPAVGTQLKAHATSQLQATAPLVAPPQAPAAAQIAMPLAATPGAPATVQHATPLVASQPPTIGLGQPLQQPQHQHIMIAPQPAPAPIVPQPPLAPLQALAPTSILLSPAAPPPQLHTAPMPVAAPPVVAPASVPSTAQAPSDPMAAATAESKTSESMAHV